MPAPKSKSGPSSAGQLGLSGRTARDDGARAEIEIRAVPSHHLAWVEKSKRVGLTLERQQRRVGPTPAALLQGIDVRVEHAAAFFLVDPHDLVQTLLGGESHQGQTA